MMLALRLVVGGLLAAALVCFALALATGQPVWRRRGVVILKWTLIGVLGFAAVIVLDREFG
jgi:hypothetical protein